MADLFGLAPLPEPDRAAREALAARIARVIRPAGALVRLDEIAVWLAGWGSSAASPGCVLFAADHGVAAEGVSAYPAGVTRAMVAAFGDGVATANVLARRLGVELAVVDVGAGRPTRNLRREPAMAPERFAEAVAAGREAVAARAHDLLVFGEMGIGNTTAAATVCASIFGGPAEEWTGLGTGLDEQGLARKVRVVEDGRRRAGVVGPLEALRQVGGAELAAIAGAIVEARMRRIPVILDGFVVTAAAAALEVARPGALDHCVAGHRSPEPGHALLLEKLGKRPLLDLGLRLGEGSGALLAVPLVRAAIAAATEVATFEDRGLA